MRTQLENDSLTDCHSSNLTGSVTAFAFFVLKQKKKYLTFKIRAFKRVFLIEILQNPMSQNGA